jgi:hypothetical protein
MDCQGNSLSQSATSARPFQRLSQHFHNVFYHLPQIGNGDEYDDVLSDGIGMFEVPTKEIVDSNSASPWDDRKRRASHRDKRRYLQRLTL